jgi:uncharacterized membrane protein
MGARLSLMSSTAPPTFVLALAFDSPLKSREAFISFQRLQGDGTITLHDAVFIDKDADGNVNVVETIDPQPAQSAMSGGIWGALFGTLIAGPVGMLVGAAATAGLGALAAKLVDLGIPDATVQELQDATPAGASMLALLVSKVNEDGLAKELVRFSGAKIVRSNLSPYTVQRLRNALTAKLAEPSDNAE